MRVALLALLASLAPAQEADLFVVGGSLFDGVADAARPNPGVHLRGGRILAVDAAPPGGADVVRLEPDETLLPGFFDLHAHHGIDLFGRGRRDETRGYPAVMLANGVTSAFPAGEVDPDRMRALAARLASGAQVGPRLHRSGPYFGSARPGWDRDVTTDELRAEIDALAAEGVVGLKCKGITREHLAVVIERAHRHGLRVTGHLGSGRRGTVNPKEAIGMGLDRVEHFLGGDTLPPTRAAYPSMLEVDVADPAFLEICDLFVARGVYFDVTRTAFGYFGERDPEVFTPWEDERSFFTPFVRELLADRPPRPPMQLFEDVYWKKREHLRVFVERGGAPLVTVGTDHPSWGDHLTGFAFHRELHALVLSGLTPAQALRAGTINGARALGLGDTLGSVEPGKLADLVVVRGDPLADITATRAVRLVVCRGEVHAAAALLEAARGTMGPRGEDELGDW